MRLLKVDENGEFSLTDNIINNIPPYATLSHRWGQDNEEVNFKDLTQGPRITKPGYKKLRFCAEQAALDRLQHFWVDTCCIDKSNSVELSEAINSMFRWYHNASSCYVYLPDVVTEDHDHMNIFLWEPAFRKSLWFTRGWTLQELIAPPFVKFFCSKGKLLGDKKSLERQLHEITGIAVQALRGTSLSEFSVKERMSWAESRETQREEDKAYSLLGIFNIHMPLIYGEGAKHALRRLQEEIDKNSPVYYPRDRLPYAVESPFNSYVNQYAPTCLPNTRIDLLREIYNWANGQDEPCIFWLNGLAGTGKSTIARTIAQKYFNNKRLGASFFFSRGGGDVGNASKFVTTIAVQLADRIPALRQYIGGAVAERTDITSRSLRDQWHELVLGPLSKLDSNGCQSFYVLVVDALDECDDENDIRVILHLFAEARLLKNVQLRVFLTSRPEIPIRHGFRRLLDDEHQDFVLHNISQSLVDHDISILLESSLEAIRQERSLDAGWPGEEIVRQLVQFACGLFIWAATACRFIHEGKRFAAKRLDMILKGSGSAVTEPEKHLDEIYTTVLSHSVPPQYTEEEKKESYRMLRQILGSIVILFSPLSTQSLHKLLHVTESDIDQTLEDLHSIVDIPKDNACSLRLHHPSFRDFILSKDRCQEPNISVDEKQAHQTLVECCLRHLSSHLKQDMCEVHAPGALVTDLDSGQIAQSLPPELQYACLYWISHLQKSGAQLHDNDEVHRFLQKHLLHWLEALSWMGKITEGIYAIGFLESIAAFSDCSYLQKFIHDIKRFVLYNRPAIEQAPLQTYHSALLFAPTMSIVRKQFGGDIPQWLQKLSEVRKNWNALIQTLEGHSGPVMAVGFSPDGQTLASASGDHTVKLWDVGSGAGLQTLEGHSSLVTAVGFSPDGQTLASASGDHTVKLWDVGSGTALQTLEGHSSLVTAVAFSPDSQTLASAAGDHTVKLWDAGSGAALQTLEGHSSWVNAVAFSPDGQTLASASHDVTVKLWDARSGAALQTLEGHFGSVNAVAFSPDGQTLASAADDRTVKLWDVGSGAALQTLEGHSSWVNAVAFSPDGQTLASASGDGTVKLWDAGSGAALQTLEGHPGWVNAVAFSPDGQTLASASHDCTVKLWDTGSGAALRTLEGHSSLVYAVAFSPDGQTLASASHDYTVKLWDTGSGAALQTLEGHSGWVNAVAFSPDGQTLASASHDYTVKLWDTESGAALQTLEGHSGWVNAVAFSPDGQTLASASYDDTVKLWDAESGAALQTLEVNLSLQSLSFSEDGTYLLTDRGFLQLEYLSERVAFPQPKHPSTFINGQWLTCGGENILWLPPEHRPSRGAVYGNVIGLGYLSGRVLVMKSEF